jgi:hypothetical protein
MSCGHETTKDEDNPIGINVGILVSKEVWISSIDLALVIFKFGIEFHQLLIHLEGIGKYKSIYERFSHTLMMYMSFIFTHYVCACTHTSLVHFVASLTI